MSSKRLLAMLVLLLMLIPAALAADPGHVASSISAGTFENGNFTFPDDLYITEKLGIGTYSPTYNLEVNGTASLNDSLFVLTSGRVGIGTSAPTVSLGVIGTINASVDVLVAGESVCLNTGTNCPAGAVDQNVWFAITADNANVKADSTTDNLTINGSGQGIDTTLTGDTVMISFDAAELASDSIAEAAINFATSCTSGNHTYIDSGNLVCEVDDDQPDNDAEVPNAITVMGGNLGNNTILTDSIWTQSGNFNISPGANDLYIDVDTLVVEGDDNQVGIGTANPTKTLEVSDGSGSITFDPTPTNPIINTTGGGDLVLHSDGGDVIIRVG